jgi:hypothetical protein
MDITKLTPEQRALLKAEIEAEEKAERVRAQQAREDYKNLVDGFVASGIKKLQKLSSEMEKVKQEIFADADTLITMKNEMFKVKSDRRSDTFTTHNGTMSITLGSRVNEGWDDTVSAGVAKVKEYIQSLSKDEETAKLVDMVVGLLAKDRKGNLRASKVLELEKMANKIQDSTFLEGVSIIKEAYRPVETCQFIQASMKDERGNEINIPLSLGALK